MSKPDLLALALDALKKTRPYLDDIQDEGPMGEGWKSGAFRSALGKADEAIAALEAAQSQPVAPAELADTPQVERQEFIVTKMDGTVETVTLDEFLKRIFNTVHYHTNPRHAEDHRCLENALAVLRDCSVYLQRKRVVGEVSMYGLRAADGRFGNFAYSVRRHAEQAVEESNPSIGYQVVEFYTAPIVPAEPSVVMLGDEPGLAIETGQLQHWREGVANAPVPILYTDTINGRMTGRDDLWIATTSQLDTSPISAAPAVELPVMACMEGFIADSDECDFSNDTWTFKMRPGYKVGAGPYLITRLADAQAAIAAAQGEKK